MHRWSARAVHLFLVLLIMLPTAAGRTASLAAPQAGEQLFVLPPYAAPGAELYLSGAGFTPSTPLELILYGDSLPDGISLGFAATGSNGAFAHVTTLPVLPPDSYTIAVNNRTLTPSTPFSVLGAPEIVLSQPGGPPGTVVSFEVTNLLTGTLRLDYDGIPVFGPAPVGRGAYSSAFIVPRDRPAVLGDAVPLAAVNLVNGRRVGYGETVFESMPSPNPTPYSFSYIELPPGEFSAGEAITVTGQITPPPADLGAMTVKLLWKTAAGQVFPITQEAPLLHPDGTFSVQGVVPSLLNGSPAAPDNSSQVGVVLIQSGQETVSLIAYTPWGVIKPLPKFIVKVVDENNNPIPNAIVDIRAPYGADAQGQTGSGPSNSYNSVSLGLQPNQVFNALSLAYPPGESDPFNCPSTGTYGRTDANGIFTFEFDPEKVAIMGTKYILDPKVSNKYSQVPTEVVFPLTVNALYTGHGQMVNGKPAAFQLEVRFSSFSKEFYNNATNQKLYTEPYVVVMPALPAGTPIDVPAIPYFLGLEPFTVMNNFLGSGDPLYAFGKFLSFSDTTLYPDALFSFPAPYITLRFQHDSLAFGALDEANMTFTLEGVEYPFQVRPGHSTQCGNSEYEAKITSPHRLKPGAHIGTMELKDLSGHVTRRYVQLTMTSPPSWIGDSNLQNRKVYYSYSGSKTGYTSMFADVLAPGAPESTSTVGANLNKIGQVDNAAGASYNRGEAFYPGGQVTKYFNGQVDTTALNEDEKIVLQKPGPGATQINFGDSLVLMDTGRIPMFRDVWGVPPIASATIGADMWFKANLTYNGTISFGSPAGGGSSYSLLVNPSGTVGVDVFLDISALLGVVSAHASAIPEITFSIPATFENGKKLDSSRCFRYKLAVHWEASIGYCPFCLSKSGTKTIFKGHQPSDADPKVCSDPALQAEVQATAANEPPPDADPSIAADGFGHTLAVWRSDAGLVVFSSFNGIAWSAPAAITSNTSSGSPRVSFFAPNQAVAVWTQNGLTPAQAATADFDTLARNQHLAYAVWNGSAWSAPQNLTTPTTGEGSLALASCMSTATGCPASGAAAAVWVRDAGANLSLRQFRLYYAIFASGAWGSAQAVDPTSTATDSEPSIAYAAGAPWAAWVRDADRDLATLNDHFIAHRRLATGAPVEVDSSLPAGPSQPSLAIDSQGRLALAFTVSSEPQAFVSNKRQLYSARGDCTASCTWSYQALTDSHGRAIFGEGPSLALSEQDQAVITYRALGMGPLANGQLAVFAGDAPGVILGSGAVAQLHVDFASAIFNPQYLTQGTAPGWQAATTFDPLLKQVVVTAAQGQTLPAAAALISGSGQAGAQAEPIAAAEPAIFASAALLPDYAIISAELSSLFPAPGETLTATLRLQNLGAAPGRIGASPELAAAWDAPPGAGEPAGSVLVSELDLVNSVTVTLPVALPAELNTARQLYLSINPQQTIPESGYDNNTVILTTGGLPVPQGLSGSAQQGQTLVVLEWAPLSDPRVAGYRIYRQDVFGNVEPVGSTFANGFADLTPLLNEEYVYRVTSFDEFGRESARSEALLVQLLSHQQYLPLVMRPR